MRENRVKELRKSHGLTVEELAERAGISHPYLSRIENRKRGLNLPMAERIAAALGENVSAVLGIEGNSVVATAGASHGTLHEDAEIYNPQPGDFIPTLRHGENIVRWRIKSNALDRAGIKAGAVVFVDISAEAVEALQPLDCVIAQIYTDDVFGGATTVVRQFVPPSLLITNSSVKNEIPLDLDKGEAYVKGVIRGEFTPLRA
jgi:transcriptional regulator with XRE-family HTH domain